ncbi:uncharacterized protein LOC124873738 isoform X2 [Girardinichthys multiradiatus]|uniref:uncharacterized protein LOC124873738 isoform X2 n=1 Tax=Girardinichthys multiradiatus TaxID=208333 RepID=UPI001FACD8AA|nr:uncharacterized protein LOC124873738 isoform X2 [Girardinichthys multiradiatus]
MSVSKQDVLARRFILSKKEISVLDHRESELLKTTGQADEPELAQIKEEEYGSEHLQEKEEDHMVLKQETHTVMETDSGSLDIKKEPEELELNPVKEEDCESESQQMVKIEVEDISQDENHDALKQETDTLMGKYSGFPEIKEEPVELGPKKVKEEEHGAAHLQVAKKESDGSSQDENQDLLKETDTLILRTSDDQTDHQQPELNWNQLVFQNFPKTEHHQEIKTYEASGSSREEQQQKRAEETRGQSDNVEKGKKDKKMHKAVSVRRDVQEK